MTINQLSHITNDFISVKIDYDIKEKFKKLFIEAKWNPDHKTWEIPSSIENLNKFIAFLENQKIPEIEKYHEKLGEEITEKMSELVEKKEDQERLTLLIADISERKEQLEAVKKEIEKVDSARNKDLKSVKKTVNNLINVQKLSSISKKIAEYALKDFLYATDKEDLREVLAYATEAREKLLKAGFESKNLNKLSDTNLNRLDRDNFKFSANDFYDISKV